MEVSGTDKKSIFLKKPKLMYIGVYRHSSGGWMNKLHCHDFCEIMLVKSGSGKFRVDDETFPFKTGDMIVCNPRVMHNEFFDDDVTADIMFLDIARVLVEGCPSGSLVQDAPFRIVNTGAFYDRIMGYCDQLLWENELKPAYFSVISDSLLTILVSFVLRLTSRQADEIFESKRTYTEVKDFLDKNFTTIDTIDNVCRSLYINKYYLTHLFKDTLGIPPLKYLIKKRISLAKKLLAETDEPIGDVAKACGYVDVAYFCRVFKNVEGVTPLAYRRLNCGNAPENPSERKD